MRVLIASQYFPPEIHGPSARLGAFASGLARRGHDVEVVCEVPSHPGGVVAPGYGGRFVDRRHVDGYDVNFVWVRATPSKATGARIANYASYAATATIVGSARRRPDVVFASSPPLPVGSVGAALALRHRVPWVLDVRDLWPDAAVAVGEMERGRAYRLAARLERRLYRSATAITATTEDFVRAIESRGGRGKITLIRNGTQDLFLAIGLEEPDPGLVAEEPRRFTWTYAGNLGLAQGLEAAVEAAKLLGEDYRLILIGAGPRRAELARMAEELPVGTVEVRDPIPPEQAGRLLRASDALLVSLAPGFEGFVPSKLFDCCAVARPVILAAEGEASVLATEAEAALCVRPGDPAGLAEAVRRIAGDATLRTSLERHGRAFAEANSREAGIAQLEEVLESVVRTGSGGGRKA
jgi:putative colanic acid biosynthesis glycosyltransferase WcaI